ncbi:hypothetical protein KAV79_10085, partial [Candidatus Aerophobetes bacterium]|nr:hypothetical protein [Candidatus Aerophobetes bacterium]
GARRTLVTISFLSAFFLINTPFYLRSKLIKNLNPHPPLENLLLSRARGRPSSTNERSYISMEEE